MMLKIETKISQCRSICSQPVNQCTSIEIEEIKFDDKINISFMTITYTQNLFVMKKTDIIISNNIKRQGKYIYIYTYKTLITLIV